MTFSCGGFNCDHARRAPPSGFVDDAADALREWRSRNSPLSERDAEEIRSRFARGPGAPAESDTLGRNVHVRDTDATAVGEFVADADTALVALDHDTDYADYHAVPVGDDEYIPLVTTAAGEVETVADRFHHAYHALERVRDRLGDSDHGIMTDGGDDETVTPDQQCLMCDARAVDPTDATPLCESHLHRATAGDADSDADGDADGETTGSGESRSDTSRADREDTDPSGPITPGPSGESHPTAVVDETAYPPAVTERDVWVNWILDGVGRKRPVAPWKTGHLYPVEWNGDLDSDDRPETDFETARRWVTVDTPHLSVPDDAQSDEPHIGILLPNDRPPREERICLIDWDDVRDPETGAIHPVAAAFIDEYGGYVEVSTSGEGLHQFVFGGLRKRGKFIAPIDETPFVGDELPQVEIYDGGRHVAMTGRHVAGTDSDAVAGQDMIDELVRRFADAEKDAGHRRYDPDGDGGDSDGSASGQSPDAGGGEVPPPETGEYDGPPLDALLRTKPDDRPLGYHAVVEAFYRGAGNSDGYANVLNWRLEGAAAALGAEAGLDPATVKADLAGAYLDDTPVDQGCRHETPHRVDYGYERTERGAFEAPTLQTLVTYGVLPTSVRAGRDDTAGAGWRTETCSPPAVDRQPFDQHDHWDHLQGERIDDTLAADGPVVWADPAGSGKTTNAGRGYADRDRPHFVSFQNHRKAREYQTDDATPDGYYHLRGGAQKRFDDCLDADHAGDDCPDHGDTRHCPHACPVYDLDSDHPTRQMYDAVKEAVGPVEAHVILADELAADANHDDDGSCWWFNQYSELTSEERVVGVHEYLTLKTVRDPSDGPTRQVIVDEYTGPERVATDTELGVERLTRAERFLDNLGATDTEREAFDALASFLRDVRDAVADSETTDPLAAAADPTDRLAEIADDRRLYVDGPDSDDVPAWADDVQTESYDPDPTNDMSRAKRDRHYVETDGVAELLARAAVSYREALRTRFEHDPERAAGVPYDADAILALVASTTDDPTATRVRKAMTAPTRATTCPRCGGDLLRVVDDPDDWSHVGGRACDDCGWETDRHNYLPTTDRPARATAWVTSDPDGTDTGVTVRRLPAPDSLPDDPLLLDATARPDPVAGLFDVSVDDVTVFGDDPARYDGLEVTQVIDGQYHPGTLKRSETARERVAKTLRKLGSAHGDLLVVGPKRLYTMFESALPDGTEWLSYHATRGLNRAEYDAVVCVGAPHPRVADLRRNAALLAQDRPDLRAGGREHSTRRDARPPVYRRLDYRDDDGDGRAVPTKHYDGLTGELFQQSREDELAQAVHRIRPLLADDGETNHAYLLTNVPTQLPVDTLATFDELAEPLRALLPVHDGALRLARYVGEVEAGDGPDGFRAAAFTDDDDWRVAELHRLAQAHGETVSERQVRRWVDDLSDIGLLDAGRYQPRAGVPYEPADTATLTRALQVLRGDGGVEVALQRRFGQYLREAESVRDWLAWARRNLALTGEVERWAGGGDAAATPVTPPD